MLSDTVPGIQSSGKSTSSSPNGRWTRYLNTLLAREVSSLTRYYDRVIQWLPRENDSGQLLQEVEARIKETVDGEDHFPNLSEEEEYRTAVLINGALNHHFDVQGLLSRLKPKLSRTLRLLLVLYNPYFRWLYLLANRVGIRRGEVPTTFLRRVDLESLAKISGFEIVSEQPIVYCPFRLLGLGSIFNRAVALVPLLRWISLAYLSVWRPVVAGQVGGLSCVIPARNERGNIENALQRFPRLGCEVEIIFVEGHSSDGTW